MNNQDLALSTELLDPTTSHFYEVDTYLHKGTGIPVVPVIGYISRYNSDFNPTTLQNITSAINQWVEKGHKAIMLKIDSPGGDSRGLFEFTSYLRELSSKKGIVFHAYIENTCASAAYLIASACAHIEAHDSALIGSVGAIIAIPKTTDDNIKVFVSELSPKKRLTGDELDAELQMRVDELGERFLQDLIINRQDTREHILENYGQGGMLNSTKALGVNMIDQISTGFTATITRLHKFMTNEELQAELALVKEQNSELTSQLTMNNEKMKQTLLTVSAEAKLAECKRQSEISALSLTGHEAIISAALLDPTCTPEKVAMSVLLAEKALKEAATSALKADDVGHVAVAATNDDDSLLAEFGGDQSLVDAYTSAQKDFELIGIDK